MNLQQIRWPVVLAVMSIALGGLFGTGWLVKSRTVDQPLRSMLSGAAQVESAAVEQEGGIMAVRVRLKDGADLKQTYGQLDRQVKRILKSAEYELTIEGQPTPELEQVAKRVDLYVQEAIATGQYATMAGRVDVEANKIGASADIGVDSQRVYVQLTKGDAYLYSVVERAAGPSAPQEGGLGL